MEAYFKMDVKKVIKDRLKLPALKITTLKHKLNHCMQIKEELIEARHLNDFKKKFISMNSHEFGTPLSNIKVSIENCKFFLKQDINPVNIERILDKLNDIITDADRISDLVSDVMIINTAEECQLPYNPAPVSINEFIQNYLALEGRKIMGSRDFRLSLSAENDLVYIDIKLMYHILQNVISNAIKYSPVASPIEITTSNIFDKVLVEIRDFGIGISVEDRPFVFQQFFRSKNVEHINGTGLGLSIVKTYLAMNKGTIEIESKINEGTSIKIYLPKF